MIVTSKTPMLDLHGEIEAMVEVLVNEFINDNYKMYNKTIVVIHGKSSNILTRKLHEVLSQNTLVKDYKLDNWNLGQTIVELNIR